MTTSSTLNAPAVAWGYQRVSTTAQTNDRQTDALIAAGIDPAHIESDKISGAKQSRPGLDRLIGKDGKARPGDSITVASLDRLGRSALHVMQTIADLADKGIDVRSLKPSENMGGATGELMKGLMILVGQWERQMNAERVAEARAARAARAKAGEQVDGRPRSALTPDKVAKVRNLRGKGRSAVEIATKTGMSRASVYRALNAD
jgi:DNA invertase Pin-like site-specific DNA recombinase